MVSTQTLVIAAAATTVLAPVAAPLVLYAAGFGASGVIAGSAAATVQAGIGNVAAGSLFASLQSAGVAGLALGTKAVIGSIAGGTVTAVGGLTRYFGY